MEHVGDDGCGVEPVAVGPSGPFPASGTAVELSGARTGSYLAVCSVDSDRNGRCDADDRYRPYRDGFEAAPVVAYLFHPSEPRAQWATTAAELDAQGVTYRREEIAGFTVLIVRR